MAKNVLLAIQLVMKHVKPLMTLWLDNAKVHFKMSILEANELDLKVDGFAISLCSNLRTHQTWLSWQAASFSRSRKMLATKVGQTGRISWQVWRFRSKSTHQLYSRKFCSLLRALWRVFLRWNVATNFLCLGSSWARYKTVKDVNGMLHQTASLWEWRTAFGRQWWCSCALSEIVDQ